MNYTQFIINLLLVVATMLRIGGGGGGGGDSSSINGSNNNSNSTSKAIVESNSSRTDDLIKYYTGQQDFVPRKVYCVSNVTFHAESKYAIKSFPSLFVQWHFYY
jgi:hypothetical protein